MRFCISCLYPMSKTEYVQVGSIPVHNNPVCLTKALSMDKEELRLRKLELRRLSSGNWRPFPDEDGVYLARRPGCSTLVRVVKNGKQLKTLKGRPIPLDHYEYLKVA